MKNPCPKFEPDLSAWLDDELPAAERAALDAHLRGCEPCRGALAQIRGVSRALRRWDALETRYATSTGFRNRVYATIGAGSDAQQIGPGWRVAAAVALVAAGATGFALLAPRLRGSEDDPVRKLTAEIQRLHEVVEARGTAAAPASVAAKAPPVARLDGLDPVIVPPQGDDPEPVAAPDPAVWDTRDGRSYERAAVQDHDDFVRDRDRLEIEEKLREMRSPPQDARNAATSAPPAPTPFATYLGQLTVAPDGAPAGQAIHVWPVTLGAPARSADRGRVLPCKDAMFQRVLSVSEGDSKESVLAVNNDAKRPVMVLAGDVFFGAGRDRVAREDVLVGPLESVSIPTFASGLPRRRLSSSFSASNGIAPPALRVQIAAERARLGGGFDQRAFDGLVQETIKVLASPQVPGSLNNLFFNGKLLDRADGLAKGFEKRLDDPGVVGIAVTAGSELLGVEVFGDHATFLDHRSRLLRSYMMAVIETPRLDGVPPSRESLSAVVASVAASAFHVQTRSGSGFLSILRRTDGGPFGLCLTDANQRILHAVLFRDVPADPALRDGTTGRRPETDGGAGIDSGREGGGGSRGSGGDGGVEAK